MKTPDRIYLVHWIKESPSHRQIAYAKIPRYTGRPFRTKAIHTAFDLIGYTRKKTHKKGFSDDLAVVGYRPGITWSHLEAPRE